MASRLAPEKGVEVAVEALGPGAQREFESTLGHQPSNGGHPPTVTADWTLWQCDAERLYNLSGPQVGVAGEHWCP